MIRKPTSVRVATPADIEPLYWMLLRDLEADNSMGVPVSPLKVLALVKRCCSGEGGIVGVIEERGKIVGSVGIIATEPNFSDAIFLQQMWLFVTPEARKGHPERAGVLFRFCMWHKGDMSQRLGYDVPLEISVISRKRLPQKLRLWGRHGDMIGGVFWARIPDEHRQHVNHHPINEAVPGASGRLQLDPLAGE